MAAAISSSSFIVIAVIVLAGIGTVYGIKTRKGSGINEHPGPDSSDPVSPDPGEKADAEADDDSTLGQRGTR